MIDLQQCLPIRFWSTPPSLVTSQMEAHRRKEIGPIFARNRSKLHFLLQNLARANEEIQSISMGVKTSAEIPLF